MKYTIHGFSQQKAIELGLDSTDLLLLRWFVDFQEAGSMKRIVIDNKNYYWVKYDYVIQELPILSIKKTMLYRIMMQLVEKNILCHYHDQQTKMSYYSIGSEYTGLVTDSVQNDGSFGTKIPNLRYKNTEHNSSINNSSINNILDDKTNDIYTESTPLESINANASSDAQLYIGTKPKKVKVERTKKDKQADIINNYTKDDSVKDALYRYIRSRKESGRYVSTEALTLLLRQLDEVDSKVASIEQSILKNYTAFYKVVTHGTDNKYSKEYRDVVDRYGLVQLPPHLQNINNEDD